MCPSPGPLTVLGTAPQRRCTKDLTFPVSCRGEEPKSKALAGVGLGAPQRGSCRRQACALARPASLGGYTSHSVSCCPARTPASPLERTRKQCLRALSPHLQAHSPKWRLELAVLTDRKVGWVRGPPLLVLCPFTAHAPAWSTWRAGHGELNGGPCTQWSSPTCRSPPSACTRVKHSTVLTCL